MHLLMTHISGTEAREPRIRVNISLIYSLLVLHNIGKEFVLSFTSGWCHHHESVCRVVCPCLSRKILVTPLTHVPYSDMGDILLIDILAQYKACLGLRYERRKFKTASALNDDRAYMCSLKTHLRHWNQLRNLKMLTWISWGMENDNSKHNKYQKIRKYLNLNFWYSPYLRYLRKANKK